MKELLWRVGDFSSGHDEGAVEGTDRNLGTINPELMSSQTPLPLAIGTLWPYQRQVDRVLSGNSTSDRETLPCDVLLGEPKPQNGILSRRMVAPAAIWI